MRILFIMCAVIVAITQSGCVGLIINSPEECENETPFTGVHDIFWKKPRPKRKFLGIVSPEIPYPAPSTKADFLNAWGTPDEIVSTSANTETWVYTRKLWCGIIPVFFLPAPLILPLCDGFDRIDFVENQATRLHTRRTVTSGIVLPNGPAGADPACRYPLPSNRGAGSHAAKPATQATPEPSGR